jgi:hypothetical protein
VARSVAQDTGGAGAGPPLRLPERGRLASFSPVRPRTVWWVVAGCLVAISAYLFFLGLVASYNSVSVREKYSLQRIACVSVYGWVRDEGGHRSSVQGEPNPGEQASLACHAAIGDRETTIEVLIGVAVVFAIVGYSAGPGDAKATAA